MGDQEETGEAASAAKLKKEQWRREGGAVFGTVSQVGCPGMETLRTGVIVGVKIPKTWRPACVTRHWEN